MIDYEKMIKQTQDVQLNSTWSGSVYALKDVLSYVDTNKDIAISSKVIIKNYLEEQIKKYQNLKDNTDIGKTLKGIEKKVGVEITQKGRKMSYKVEIELDFDTYKPSGEDVFTYIKELYEDNSLNYKLINNKTEKEEYQCIKK